MSSVLYMYTLGCVFPSLHALMLLISTTNKEIVSGISWPLSPLGDNVSQKKNKVHLCCLLDHVPSLRNVLVFVFCRKKNIQALLQMSACFVVFASSAVRRVILKVSHTVESKRTSMPVWICKHCLPDFTFLWPLVMFLSNSCSFLYLFPVSRSSSIYNSEFSNDRAKLNINLIQNLTIYWASPGVREEVSL